MAVAPGRRPRAVRVHIDELGLEGFDPRHRYRIADALERELARLLGERPGEGLAGEGAAPRAGARVDAGAITVREGEPPEHVGVAIARATFRAMHGGAPRGRGDRGGGP